MKIKIGDEVDYIYNTQVPLKCVVKKTLFYNEKNYLIIESKDQIAKSEIMVPEDQKELYIRKLIL